MKKQLFIAAMFALVMVGCSKNEVIENQSSNNLINFKPYVGNSVKAEDANTALIKGAGVGFNVYAWYNASETKSTAITAEFRPNFMDKTNVLWNVSEWEYSPAKYWPAKGSLDFIAIGNNVEPVTGTPAAGEYKFTKDASPAIEFTTSNIPANQKDLVASTDEFGETQSETAINFSLKHLLSKIDVQIKNTSDLTLDITSVKFTSIAPSATYDLVTGKWGTPNGTVAENELKLKTPLVLTKDAVIKIHEDSEALIIIPQTANSIIIEYTFKDSEGIIIEDLTGANAKSIDLSADAAWDKSTYYTYTLSITPKAAKINFNAEVADWDTKTPIEK